jgi:hypothetical protein
MRPMARADKRGNGSDNDPCKCRTSEHNTKVLLIRMLKLVSSGALVKMASSALVHQRSICMSLLGTSAPPPCI